MVQDKGKRREVLRWSLERIGGSAKDARESRKKKGPRGGEYTIRDVKRKRNKELSKKKNGSTREGKGETRREREMLGSAREMETLLDSVGVVLTKKTTTCATVRGQKSKKQKTFGPGEEEGGPD